MSGFRYGLAPHLDSANDCRGVCGDRNIAFKQLFITAFGAVCRGFFFTFPCVVAARRFWFAFLGFSGVVGHIPSSSFQVERAMRNEFMKFARTMLAFGERFVRKLLNDFFNPAALVALIFIDRHIPIFLPVFIQSKRLFQITQMTHRSKNWPNIVCVFWLSRQ